MIHKSKYISKLLRHEPEDLEINSLGFVKIHDLLKKVNISKSDLDFIVNDNDKKRFEYSDCRTMIRARQGHNKQLDVQIDTIKPISPSELIKMDIYHLYHGTDNRLKEIISKEGLKSMSRIHVHLSKDKETAITVALRKNKDYCLFKVDAIKLSQNNNLYLSANEVFLAKDFDNSYFI
jgi:putative RNA 2'-phosphotransferase